MLIKRTGKQANPLEMFLAFFYAAIGFAIGLTLVCYFFYKVYKFIDMAVISNVYY